MYKCDFCELAYEKKLSMTNHRRFCHCNPLKMKWRNHKRLNQYSKAKLLGLTQPIHPQKGKPGKGTPHTAEFKERQRQTALKRRFGGITQSRWIHYNGKILGSSYELRLAKDLDKHNVVWDTCSQFRYRDPFGKVRSYTPDLFLPEYKVYLDPKNDFLINNVNPALGFTDHEKIMLASLQNKITIFILNKNELTWEAVYEKITKLGIDNR